MWQKIVRSNFNPIHKIANHEKTNKINFKIHGRYMFKDDQTKGLWF